MARPKKNSNGNSTGTIGFEQKLLAAAGALRNNMDAAEYKHVVFGLIFLKYISDAFEATHAQLEAQVSEGADPEDPDEYRAANIFWVPKEARWSHLKANAPQPTIGKLVDDAMVAIERDHPSLKDVPPKDYVRPGLDRQRVGQPINLISDIGLGDPAERAKDTLGRVYEYFLAQFDSAEGKKDGQFYTPTHVARVLVEMLAPYKGRVYDPCCGSGGMFVQSEKFIEAQHIESTRSDTLIRRCRKSWFVQFNHVRYEILPLVNGIQPGADRAEHTRHRPHRVIERIVKCKIAPGNHYACYRIT